MRRLAQAQTVKELIGILDEQKLQHTSYYTMKTFIRTEPIKLSIIKEYIDLLLKSNIEGLERVSVTFRKNTVRGHEQYQFRVMFMPNSSYRRFDDSRINGIDWTKITEDEFKRTIEDYSTHKFTNAKPAPIIDPKVSVIDSEVKKEEEPAAQEMVVIKETETTVTTKERSTMIIKNPTENIIKMVSDRFFEFNEGTANALHLCAGAKNILNSHWRVYEKQEDCLVRMHDIINYESLYDAAKYLNKRGAKYTIIYKNNQPNKAFSFPIIGITVFKKSYRNGVNFLGEKNFNNVEEIKNNFRKVADEYLDILAKASFACNVIMMYNFNRFKRKVVKLNDIYKMAQTNEEYALNRDIKVTDKVTLLTFKNIMRLIAPQDKLVNEDDKNNISFKYDYRNGDDLKKDIFEFYNIRKEELTV